MLHLFEIWLFSLVAPAVRAGAHYALNEAQCLRMSEWIPARAFGASGTTPSCGHGFRRTLPWERERSVARRRHGFNRGAEGLNQPTAA
jgi:hypothetical protein